MYKPPKINCSNCDGVIKQQPSGLSPVRNSTRKSIKVGWLSHDLCYRRVRCHHHSLAVVASHSLIFRIGSLAVAMMQLSAIGKGFHKLLRP